MQRNQIKQYSLSYHARERLADRSKLDESQLLRLLENEAFEKVHTKFVADLPRNDINLFTTEYGLTFKEMKSHGMVNVKAEFNHLVVWSYSDQRPLTLIVDVDSKTIVTLLYSDDFSSHDWSDKITEISISKAKKKAEQLDAIDHKNKISEKADEIPMVRYELFAYWLDETGMPKRKAFSNPKIISILPLVPSAEELEHVVRLHAKNGFNITFIVRNKKDPSDVHLEKCLYEHG